MTFAPHGRAVVSDRAQIEACLRAILPAASSSVAEAMRYAVLGGGQRLRPMLALRVARMLNADESVTSRSAASVELLHCASLIVDDLPCMDNDAMRRNRASVHVEFGEATAVLAAFGLVALAAKTVAEHTRFQIKLLSTLDCNSLIGGQALDLALAGENRNRHRSYVTALKTVPLFRLAAEAGCLCPSIPKAERLAVQAFGCEYGVAYQMVDDYLDAETSCADEVADQLERARACIAGFGDRAGHLLEMLDYLNAMIQVGCQSN